MMVRVYSLVTVIGYSTICVHPLLEYLNPKQPNIESTVCKIDYQNNLKFVVDMIVQYKSNIII